MGDHSRSTSPCASRRGSTTCCHQHAERSRLMLDPHARGAQLVGMVGFAVRESEVARNPPLAANSKSSERV